MPGTTAPGIDRRSIQSFPQCDDLDRVGAEELVQDVAALRGAARHVEECADHRGGRVGLTDTLAALGIGQPDHQSILGPVGGGDRPLLAADVQHFRPNDRTQWVMMPLSLPPFVGLGDVMSWGWRSFLP